MKNFCLQKFLKHTPSTKKRKTQTYQQKNLNYPHKPKPKKKTKARTYQQKNLNYPPSPSTQKKIRSICLKSFSNRK